MVIRLKKYLMAFVKLFLVKLIQNHILKWKINTSDQISYQN